MKRLAFLFLIALFAARDLSAQVPERMMFCGMDLTIDDEAKAYIQAVIDKLKYNSARFQILVDRANTYMPFVEEAFTLTGLPDDLRWIVLQESALQGDAVSTSNAVGFWQFKEPTALEVGLMVNDAVDERRHIFRSSMAAAHYFHYLNKQFDNWVYAVIAYNRGPTGALPYLKPEYFGKDAMPIDMTTHWYALKAIAHKLAFQDLVVNTGTPRLWLEPRSSMGITSVDELSVRAGVDKERLREFNLWMIRDELPAGRSFTYYVPHENEPLTLSLSDPLMAQNPQPQDSIRISPPPQVVVEPVAMNPDTGSVPLAPESDPRFVFRKIEEDPGYGSDFIKLRPGVSLIEEAVKAGVRAFRLMEWNGIEPGEIVRPGTVIHLVPKEKALYHIVKKGETPEMIAIDYGMSVSKLAKLNRFHELGFVIYQDQRLNLKKKKPAGENIVILLREERKKSLPPVQPQSQVNPTPPEVKPAVPPAPDHRLPEYETRIITHTVVRGETLWSISKMYNTSVDVIKMMNKLADNQIMPGQRLQVMQQIEKR